MMPKELEPSTLEPLIPASAPASKTGIGAKAALPAIWDFEASFESAYWNSQLTAKADFAGDEVVPDRVLIRGDRAGVGQAIVDGLLHPGQSLDAFIVVEGRLTACIQECAAVAKQQDGEIADHAFLLVPRPDDRDIRPGPSP